MQSAIECREFAISPARTQTLMSRDVEAPGPAPGPARPEDVEIRVYEAESRLYTVLYPAEKFEIVHGFWMNAGVGLPSRMAERNLACLDSLKQISYEDDATFPRPGFQGQSHKALQERIASLLDRAPLNPHRTAKPSADDVYLFPTGMAGIYKLHTYLLRNHNEKSVLFGMAFHATAHVFAEYGPGYKFFGLGTDRDLDDLESYLEAESQENRKVQTVFAEFPTNPNLVVPDLTRLRVLADKYDFILCIDDTISGFANVDLLDAADVLTTSLTKAFSGYADVIAGSVVLNPCSRKYRELKSLFQEHYVCEFYHLDAEVLLHNSNDYLQRTAILNHNAAALTSYLHARSRSPTSPIVKIHYPPYLPSLQNYNTYLRPTTPDLTPGYGCLFTIEFEDSPTTAAFYDNINVHCGPHLGAHLTLAMPYTTMIYGNFMKWATQYGLRGEQIRISVGLEETNLLLEDFSIALDAAEKVKAGR